MRGQQQQGFIFLITMLITVVISLLVLTSMQHLLLYHKVINRQEVLHQRFYQLETVALQLTAARASGCISHQDSANQAVHKLLQHQGCSLKAGEFVYQYFIEDLGSFSCLVAYEKGQKRATHHQRISVVTMEEGRTVSLLQIRFISLGVIANCMDKERIVSLGVSSWRYLPSVQEGNY